WNSLNKTEPGANCALSIMFMGSWVAEIGENTVAHVLGDKAAVALDQLRAAAVIGSNNAPKVLRVEPARQCSRAHQIAEHDCQLTAFGVISPSWLGRNGSRRCRYGNRSVVEIADCAQHFQPVPERNPKIFQMLIGQVGENRHVNVVLGKPL